MVLTILLFLLAGTLAAQEDCTCPDTCRTTTNIASWFGKDHANTELDDRTGEYGYHTPQGDWFPVRFLDVPQGSRVRIERFAIDHYGTFTGRDKSNRDDAAAVILAAIHTKEHCQPRSEVNGVPKSACDAWLWVQTPVGVHGAWRYLDRTGDLLPSDTVWIKQAMFANPDGREMLVESTVEWTYCFESP